MKLEIFVTDFRKPPTNTNFHGSPSSGSRVFSMRTDRRTDLTKLIVVFRNFTKMPTSYLNFME